MPTVALILAAGAGTRMKSDKPKVIHEVLGVPMIQLVVDAAAEAGCVRTIVVTGHGAEQVEAVLPLGDVEIVNQPKRIGTANAVQVAQEALAGQKGLLVVLSGDVPLLRPQTIKDLVAHCRSTKSVVTVLTASIDDPTGYGRIVRDEDGNVTGIVEHNDATEDQLAITEINTGIYCFKLEGLFDRLDCIGCDNSQGEHYLTDIVSVCLEQGSKVTAVQVADPQETNGVNSRVQLAEATRNLQNRINTHWMLEGVSIVAPELTWISPYASFAQDVEILPMSSIMGESVIESGAVIGPDTRITDSLIQTGAVIDSSIVVASSVGPDASVGPRAYLRPGTVLEARAKAGTCVELKNTHLGEGTKVPHLSYIGDAEIGERCNIGAGTITCNYDGVKKSITTIGSNVFIGSDTMLIAPVSVGDGAMIGASSAITKDVPAGALAIERSQQVILEGWVARNRD